MHEYSALFKELYSAFSNKKFSKIRRIHERMVNLLIQNFSDNFFRLCLISYVLSKIISKPRFFSPRARENIKKIESILHELSSYPYPSRKFNRSLAHLESTIISLEENDPRYIFDLFTKARIKVGATLYAKGISLGKVSKITSIPKEEILSYAGKTLMFDRVREERTMRDRVKMLKRIILEG